MSQHDFNIANQTASATRADLNNALAALVTTSSSTSAPATTFANMMYYNTSDNWLYFRNEADSSWIRFAYFDQPTGQMAIQDSTYIVGTTGSQAGIIGNQANAVWQAGTSTLNSLVSPNRIRLAIEASDELSIGGENTEGYVKMSSGLIFQWGTTPNQSGGVTITLPTTYPTAHTGAVASVARTTSISNGNITAYAEPNGTTQIIVVHDGYGPGSDNVSSAVTWLSWGH
tara:strand:+ start:554 stop:1240 length:687 start_codon:yes stop_codon:yes gene_type:complete